MTKNTFKLTRLLLVFITATLCMISCSVSGQYVWVDKLPAEAYRISPYTITEGDLVTLHIWNQPNLSGDLRVRPDGKITVPLIGDITVAGITPPACAKTITQRLKGLVLEPKVTLSLKEVRRPNISVIGEVRNVGEYTLRPDDTLLQILARAGGLTEFASVDHIYILRHSPNRRRIRVTYAQLINADERALSFRLRNGDVVVVH